MGRRLITSRLVTKRLIRFGALVVISVGVLLVTAATAAATDTWTRSPSHALPGASITVASAANGACVWLQPSEVPGGVETFDGTRVEISLRASSGDTPLGTVGVSPGGAWSGAVVLADATAGSSSLVARCIVDHPALDGVRSFELEPLPFDVDTAPPQPPVVGPPPLVIVAPEVAVTAPPVAGPTQVLGQQVERRGAPSGATRTGSAARLPLTGPSELPATGGSWSVALAGLASLGLGGGAIWWGQRADRDRETARSIDT